MKKNYWIGLSLYLLAHGAFAQQITETRLFFPYFRLADAPKTQMPLMHQNTQIVVQMDGLRAEVKVLQIYKNTTNTDLALACVVPTDIDNLVGEIDKAVLVRKPNLPKNNYLDPQQLLAMPTVLAGKMVELRWEYKIMCETEADVSTFRLPAFAPSPEDANVHYELKILFHTDLPIQDISSQEHLIEVHYPTSNTAEVVFASKEAQAGTRPFLLQYKFYQSKIKTIIPKTPENLMRGDAPKEGYEVSYLHIKKGDEAIETLEHTVVKYYEVKENDYIEKIANKFGVTEAHIRLLNHLKEHTILKKGTRLKMEVPCLRITHIVAEDEYPYQIAQLYDVSASEILLWNNLKDTDKLEIGQKIIIYHPKK